MKGPTHARPPAPPSSRATRVFISPAALLVKVTAMTSRGLASPRESGRRAWCDDAGLGPSRRRPDQQGAPGGADSLTLPFVQVCEKVLHGVTATPRSPRHRAGGTVHRGPAPPGRPGGTRPGSGAAGSLHGDALGEIARLVHVTAPQQGDVVGQQLERHGQDRGSDELPGGRRVDDVIGLSLQFPVALVRQGDDDPPGGPSPPRCCSPSSRTPNPSPRARRRACARR